MFPEPQGVITTFLAGAREIIRPNRIVRIEVKIPEFHDMQLLCENRHQHNETSFRLSYSRALRMFRTHPKQNSLEPCRRNNDPLSQPLHVSLHGLGVARDRTHHHLMHASVTVTFHLV